jgi:hypothetical protein
MYRLPFAVTCLTRSEFPLPILCDAGVPLPCNPCHCHMHTAGECLALNHRSTQLTSETQRDVFHQDCILIKLEAASLFPYSVVGIEIRHRLDGPAIVYR